MTARKTGIIVGAVAGLGVAAAAMAGVGMRMPASAAAADQAGLISPSNTPLFAPPRGAPSSFADIFERVSPAVVSIDVISRGDPRAAILSQIPGLGGLEQQPQAEEKDKNGPQRLPRQQASGSGFFISKSGYVVTNNHVVENAEEILVTLKDGRELPAKVIGKDESTDLAVLKVEGSNFPFVNFEKKAKPRVGDWVITIGNPFGLGGTATAGIVSAYGRDLRDTAFVDYIQVDAPINRGNSGGPTFDVYGRVIGVNSAIVSPTGGSVGIGFAIPADIAESVVNQLIANGKITRGYIGAVIQDFTADMGDARGFPGQKGAIITNLTAGGPAAQAGLLPGDVAIAVNGAPVRSGTELTRQVSRVLPGQTLKVEVIRDDARKTLIIKAGTRPGDRELAGNGAGDDEQKGGEPAAPTAPEPKTVVLGLALMPIDPVRRQRYTIPDEVSGLVVDGLIGDSDAADRGLTRGDVITSINNRQLNSPAEAATLVDAAKKAGRDKVLLGVYTKAGRPGYLTVKITP